MIWINGIVYLGNWSNDLMHGNGMLKYPNGEVVIGKWWDGELITNN